MAGHGWKLPVRTALLLLSAACAAQNAAVSAVALGLGGTSLATSVVGGAYFVFAAFVLTAIILFGGFAYSVFDSAANAQAAVAANHDPSPPEDVAPQVAVPKDPVPQESSQEAQETRVDCVVSESAAADPQPAVIDCAPSSAPKVV